MRSIFNLTRLTAFLLLVTSLADVSASVVYQYIGNNFNSFSSPSSYDSSMMVTITLEVPYKLPLNSVSGVNPALYGSEDLIFTFEDGVQSINNTNVDPTSITLEFTVDASGNITAWTVIAAANDPVPRNIYSLKHFSDSDNGEDGGEVVAGDWGGIGNMPGAWSVVPIPAALYLFGSGLLCMVSIARKSNS